MPTKPARKVDPTEPYRRVLDEVDVDVTSLDDYLGLPAVERDVLQTKLLLLTLTRLDRLTRFVHELRERVGDLDERFDDLTLDDEPDDEPIEDEEASPPAAPDASPRAQPDGSVTLTPTSSDEPAAEGEIVHTPSDEPTDEVARPGGAS